VEVPVLRCGLLGPPSLLVEVEWPDTSGGLRTVNLLGQRLCFFRELLLAPSGATAPRAPP
jgi:hypothetical protein